MNKTNREVKEIMDKEVMDEWARKYPLAAYLMFTNDSNEEKEEWVNNHL